MRQITGVIREWKKSKGRSPRWPKVRKEFLKTHPECTACGSKNLLQVHHMSPFHTHPELELDPKNLITLCMASNECHLTIGHGGNWRDFNPTVLSDALSTHDHPEDREAIVERVHANRQS